MTPGYKTTEFWLTLLAHLMSALVLCDVVAPGSPWAKVVAVVTMMLSALGYGVSRAMVKKSAATPLEGRVMTTLVEENPGVTKTTSTVESTR